MPIRKDKHFYDNGSYKTIVPLNLDEVIAQADKTKFNMGFMTDIHTDAHNMYTEPIDTKIKHERRWNMSRTIQNARSIYRRNGVWR